jgi:hypothetical protein
MSMSSSLIFATQNTFFFFNHYIFNTNSNKLFISSYIYIYIYIYILNIIFQYVKRREKPIKKTKSK